MRETLPTIRIADRADPAALRRLEEAIVAFNIEATGIADARDLFAELRDDENEVLAGVYGWSWGRTCWIELLWVRADRRARGVGSALIAAVEAEARDRGCVQMALTTHSFQAPDFYRRLGFEQVGELDDYPSGHSDLLLRRRLG